MIVIHSVWAAIVPQIYYEESSAVSYDISSGRMFSRFFPFTIILPI